MAFYFLPINIYLPNAGIKVQDTTLNKYNHKDIEKNNEQLDIPILVYSIIRIIFTANTSNKINNHLPFS